MVLAEDEPSGESDVDLPEENNQAGVDNTG